MITVDQRILIPAPQSLVWDYLSDLSRNSSWQADCASVSFLSSKRQGPGTRLRYNDGRGREAVIEIAAWYNGLGYEYRYVDGPNYKDNRGWLRLQEIPEGTIVQWTFSYETGGLLGGGRGNRKQLEQIMATSLKTLWKQVTQLSKDMNIESKSLMRDAPDVNARQQYKPRHPTQARPQEPPLAVEPPIRADDAQQYRPVSIYDEPPIKESDTRPRPAIEAPPAASLPSTGALEEPDFLVQVDEPAVDESAFDTTPIQAVDFTVGEDISAITAEKQKLPAEAPKDLSAAALKTDEHARPAPRTEALPKIEPVKPAANETTGASAEAAESPLPQPPAEAPHAERAGHIELPKQPEQYKSIWEVFGIPRPGDSQEIAKAAPAPSAEPVVEPPAEVVQAEEEPAPPAAPTVETKPSAPKKTAKSKEVPKAAAPLLDPARSVTPSGGRRGLRARARIHAVKLRRPL